ncbi:hypothetical protein F4774DRAFT_267532 [Daldinia eschscholtzii]|nr:hypothetical protein F4774DRAFT_267532 [Daldinia eschscholtzii]
MNASLLRTVTGFALHFCSGSLVYVPSTWISGTSPLCSTECETDSIIFRVKVLPQGLAYTETQQWYRPDQYKYKNKIP